MIEETGVGIKNPLWFVGVVENRNDPRKEGRVQVRAFGVHGTNAQVPPESLPWAMCISGNYDPNYPIPPLNAWVFGFFIDGRDAQQPMILGLIPTQMTGLIDPEVNGWGVIPTENVNLDSQGSRATDYGQPQSSRKARGEDIQNTDILFQEVNRLSADFSSIEEGFKIEEPSPGYNAIYPYNRVIETAGGHSIELDDSPGGERIRIWHSKGAYVEMHQSGAVVLKATNDLWLGAEGNICIVGKARQLIKVEGDAVMSVDGNMSFEVNGDMRQTVRGNYELSVGGQLNLNGSEEIQARAAKIRLEANVEGINIKSGKNINMQSGEAFNIKSGTGINQQAVGDINIKADGIFIEGAGAFNVKTDTMFLTATGTGDFKADHAKIGGGTKVSINASIVAIDDIIQLANGDSVEPDAAEAAIDTPPAEGADLPEPVAKSAGNGNGSGSHSYGYKNDPMGGTGGYISQDDFNNSSESYGTPVGFSDYVQGDYSDLESALRAQGFTENEILATLAIVGGESGGNFAVSETSYSGTSNDRIRSIFSRTRSLSDEELTRVKSSDTTFFNYVYGGQNGNGASNNDGYDYRGRSFIQLTFRANYDRYAKLTGYDIVSNPNLLNTDISVASAVTAAYLKDRVRRTGDPVSDVRAAVAGTSTGLGYTMNIEKDRSRYERLLRERGTMA